MFTSIKNLLVGFITVFKHLFKTPVTLEYPEKKQNVNEYFRGKPKVDSSCIHCGTCIKVCPTSAIRIDNDKFYIDMKKCIFCGNCSFYCSKKAIKMSSDYELATNNSENLVLVYKIGGEDECDV